MELYEKSEVFFAYGVCVSVCVCVCSPTRAGYGIILEMRHILRLEVAVVKEY